MTSEEPEAIVRRFIEAFDAADLDTIATCLGENVVAEVTQRDASTVQLQGRAAYMANIEALDIPTVRPRVWITQIAKVSEDQVLFMVEGKAARKGRKLHNHAAYLMTIKGGEIQRIWMVEALPEESDTFWKS
ncbi:MAG: nuclear transport factor 2 family protein [Hyphomicrobiaceae bacterium]|nr:nuclear transport factor 2 family protein [Hyphomicrobiaceae bacterium]